MTSRDLTILAARHCLTIDGFRGGAGKFRDIYVGTGANPVQLLAFVSEFKQRDSVIRPIHRIVNVPGHKDFGKPYVEIPSFWWEPITFTVRFTRDFAIDIAGVDTIEKAIERAGAIPECEWRSCDSELDCDPEEES